MAKQHDKQFKLDVNWMRSGIMRTIKTFECEDVRKILELVTAH
ncbi:hypothetical protein [uncultured Veillonella sp.]|nr:hypothetical protein [uncultured Veillonella sp.]